MKGWRAAAPPLQPMRIERLSVRNYCARAIDLAELTPFTVLLGSNGSGKSTLFDVFSFLSECGCRRVAARVGPPQGPAMLLPERRRSRGARHVPEVSSRAEGLATALGLGACSMPGASPVPLASPWTRLSPANCEDRCAPSTFTRPRPTCPG